MKKSIFALTVLCFSLCSWGGQVGGGAKQDQTKEVFLEGRVGDFFHKPISGAKIIVEGTKWQPQTNEKGQFERFELTPGSYTIRVTHPQYRTLICKNFELSKGGVYAGFMLKNGSSNDEPVIRDDRPLGQFVIDEDAEPIEKVEPVYPASALKDKIEGTVSLNLYVSETGEVLNAWVAQGVREDLNHAALEAVQNMKFKPAKVKGKSISVPLTIPFNFKLADKSSEFPLNQANGPLTNDDIVSALDYLGIQTYRFSYEIPFKHRVSYSLERYIDGKRLNFENTGYGATQPGKCNMTLFKYVKADSVQFTLRLVTGGYIRVFGLGRYPVGGYPASSWIPFSNLRMQSHKKVPICAYVLTTGALRVTPDQPLEKIIASNKLVFVVSAELVLE